MTKTLPIICLFLFVLTHLQGQDLHFSQYYNTPLNINPALTGIFKEDIRFMANYRSQWQSVPVPFMTVSGAADMKYFHEKLENGFFGGGVVFNYDQQGDLELSLAEISFSGSYTQQLDDNNFLSAGFQAGVAQRSFDEAKLRVSNQWQGDTYDPSLPTKETFESNSIGFADLSAGVNYYWQEDDRKAYLNAGVGVFHLNRPKKNFTGTDEERRRMRSSMYAFGGFQAMEKMDVLLFGLGQLQGEENELVVGSGVKYNINETRGKELAVRFTTAVRLAGEVDAVIPAFEIHYLTWRFGFSYDINLSQFNVATNNAGGPELAIRHVITKVKPLRKFKTCPIF